MIARLRNFQLGLSFYQYALFSIKETRAAICTNLTEKSTNRNLTTSSFPTPTEAALRNKDTDDNGNSKTREDTGCRECL